MSWGVTILEADVNTISDSNAWEHTWEICKLVNRPNFGLCLDTFQICGKRESSAPLFAMKHDVALT